MMASVFPIERRAWEGPHYAQSPNHYRQAFLAAKPAGVRFYAFDANVLSRTEIEFIAYDMRDSFFGGIGEEVWRGKADVSASLTKDDVDRAIHKHAASIRQAELDAQEAEVVRGYADMIRATIDYA